MAANRFELLATWYLRFNGFLTVPDFVVHKDYRKRPGGTDADVLAVRFPHSCEYQRGFEFKHDSNLVRPGNKVDFVICEVKEGLCDLNDPWLNNDRHNVEYVLRWMGFERDDGKITQTAADVYGTGISEHAESGCSVRFVVIGGRENPILKERLPRVAQILHVNVVDFLRFRFTTGCEGINREHWDAEIVEFAELCRRADSRILLSWAEAGPTP